MRNGLSRDIDCTDMTRPGGQVMRPKAFTAGCIEHGLAGDQLAGQHIAMHVLIPDLTHALRRETLTGKLELI